MPQKVTRPNGSVHTACYIIGREEASLYKWLKSAKILTSMRPHYVPLPTGGSNRGAFLRLGRSFSKPPRFSLEEFFVYLTTRLCEVYVNSLLRGEVKGRDIFEKLVENCIYIEDWKHQAERYHIVPTNVSRIKLSSCLSVGKNKVNLYWLHKEYWRLLIKAWAEGLGLGDLFDFSVEESLKKTVEDGKIKSKNIELNSLYQLYSFYQLVLYSLYIREFSIIGIDYKNMEVFSEVFSIKDSIDKLIRKEGSLSGRPTYEKEIISLMLALYGSYSAVGQYAMIQWYSRIYGSDLSSSTLKAYEIDYLHFNEKTGMYEPVLREESEFGYPREHTLERYLHRLDLDAIQLLAAIDVYVTKVYHNPWIRSGILTSFLRTLGTSLTHRARACNLRGSRNERKRLLRWMVSQKTADNLLVMPIPDIPELLASPFGDTRTVTLITRSERISENIVSIISDTIQHLASNRVTEEELDEAAELVRRLLTYESREIETDYIETYKEFVTENIDLFKGCAKGFLIEVLHPIEEFILLSRAITRKVAEYPSRAGIEHAITILMRRLTEAEEFKVIPYLLVDGDDLYKEYLKLENVIKERCNDLTKGDNGNYTIKDGKYEGRMLDWCSYIRKHKLLLNREMYDTYNMERLFMLINDYDDVETSLGNYFGGAGCIKSIHDIAREIALEG